MFFSRLIVFFLFKFNGAKDKSFLQKRKVLWQKKPSTDLTLAKFLLVLCQSLLLRPASLLQKNVMFFKKLYELSGKIADVSTNSSAIFLQDNLILF